MASRLTASAWIPDICCIIAKLDPQPKGQASRTKRTLSTMVHTAIIAHCMQYRGIIRKLSPQEWYYQLFGLLCNYSVLPMPLRDVGGRIVMQTPSSLAHGTEISGTQATTRSRVNDVGLSAPPQVRAAALSGRPRIRPPSEALSSWA